MTRKGRRLVLIGSALAVAAVACSLILFALSDSIVFFYSPADVAAKALLPGTRVRLGGLVEQGSVHKSQGGEVSFRVTDLKRSMPVSYTGLLPDLFREGQGVVAEGTLDASGALDADTVLAKHDERYMPRDVADKLKAQGLWNEGGPAAAPAAKLDSAAADAGAMR